MTPDPTVDPLDLGEHPKTPPKFDAFVKKVLAYRPPKEKDRERPAKRGEPRPAS